MILKKIYNFLYNNYMYYLIQIHDIQKSLKPLIYICVCVHAGT